MREFSLDDAKHLTISVSIKTLNGEEVSKGVQVFDQTIEPKSEKTAVEMLDELKKNAN